MNRIDFRWHEPSSGSAGPFDLQTSSPILSILFILSMFGVLTAWLRLKAELHTRGFKRASNMVKRFAHLALLWRLVWLLACLGFTTAPALAGTERARPEIDVILWFDTEDYLSPADDDATLRLCQLLTARDIRATFKIVGEKARVLEQRGRRDVIAALRRHDIGFHGNLHSVHPTPTEYLADCGWLDGIAEFTRHEGGGAADVRRILGVETLACYGQPGSSWGPQAIAALPAIGVAPHGVPCYVDDGSPVGLDHRPFWYAGALNVFNLGPNCTRINVQDPEDLEPGKRQASEIATRLGGECGGLISIYFHPCEWIHQEFWDGVNFKRGANPPREQWKAPPQRTAAETEAAFQRFADYLDHIRSIPGVRWVTAGDLPLLYPDEVRTTGATANDLAELARRISSSPGRALDVISIGSRVYSVADQLELLTRAVHEVDAGRAVNFPLKALGLFGPDAPPPTDAITNLNWFAFRDATRGVFQFIVTEHRVPARVFIGADAVAPGDFLAALAGVWDFYVANGKLPIKQGVTLGSHASIVPEKYVAQDTPELFGGWIIHKAGFRAPKLMELARLQAWTLKPAVRALSGESTSALPASVPEVPK